MTLPVRLVAPSITRRRFAVGACASLCLPGAFAATGYPSKPTRVVVPLGAGGSMDPIGRAVAQGLQDALGQPAYVDNRPGAAGQIGADAIAKAVGDPYNLFIGSMGIMSISPGLYPTLPYDVKRDFTPIALVARVPYALVVNPNVVPATNVREFVRWAKAEKQPISYGTSGSGSVAHISAVLLANVAGLNLQQIPYKAPAQITTDMIKGDLPMIVDSPAAYLGFANDKQLRILAVTSKERLTVLPDVPTMAESGFPDVNIVNWFGLFAPRDLPAGVADTLRKTMEKLLQSRKMHEQFAPLGLEIASDGVKGFAEFAERDRERWVGFLQANQIKLEKL